MDFKRKAYHQLLNWKKKKTRKPLLVRGARQVGKSNLVNQFSKEFSYYISVNLERDEDRQLFEELKNVTEIINALRLQKGIPKDNKSTLLFIDEIQESPRAIQLLRYFLEDLPEIYVIAAGSLLEFALRKVASFPVGRVEQLVLHPFDFEEFLMALGQEQALEQYNTLPPTSFSQSTMMNLFHVYALIGGMPDIIKQYQQDKSYANLRPIYDNLWQGYKDDVEKYSDSVSERNVIRHVMDTATREKDRIKFDGFGNSKYRSREIGEALRALDMSRIIRIIYPVTDIAPPAIANLRRSPRLQFLDTGLLNFSLNLQAEMIGVNDLNEFYRGKIIQHLVSQELIAQFDSPSFKINFWVREEAKSTSEIDLVFQHKKYLIPIEIKSGTQGKLRSLHQFVERCDHHYAIRLLANHFNVEEAKTPGGKKYFLMNLPYYLGAKIPEYIEWFVKNY